MNEPVDYEQLRQIVREELHADTLRRIKELEDCLRWTLEVGFNESKIRKVLEAA